MGPTKGLWVTGQVPDSGGGFGGPCRPSGGSCLPSCLAVQAVIQVGISLPLGTLAMGICGFRVSTLAQGLVQREPPTVGEPNTGVPFGSR